MAHPPEMYAAHTPAAGRTPLATNASLWPSGQSSHAPTTPEFSTIKPASAGTSLKPQHYQEILKDGADVDFFEVHAENYFGQGGAPHRYLTAIRDQFALSVHGIGLSIGGAQRLNPEHLGQLRELVHRYQPALVSEHLAWCESDGAYFNDLLPVALTSEALDIVCQHVAQTQDAIGRSILIENPSNYLTFEESDIPETEFLAEMARRTGCGLLLDINNVVVSAHNLQLSAHDYLDAFNVDAIGEIHLAGHSDDDRNGVTLKIDDHGSAPSQEVWDLYEALMMRAGPRPTLIEWDQDVPALSALVSEVATARGVLNTSLATTQQVEVSHVPAG
ncbi:MAG: DUF692 domain-containing protein [Candidatus Phaeomarinobacter sp.]